MSAILLNDPLIPVKNALATTDLIFLSDNAGLGGSMTADLFRDKLRSMNAQALGVITAAGDVIAVQVAVIDKPITKVNALAPIAGNATINLPVIIPSADNFASLLVHTGPLFGAADTLTVVPTGGQTIDGAANKVITGPNKLVEFIYVGVDVITR